MTARFKRRYVLGEGWACSSNFNRAVSVCNNNADEKILAFPKELDGHDVPKYRLLLERLSERRKTNGR